MSAAWISSVKDALPDFDATVLVWDLCVAIGMVVLCLSASVTEERAWNAFRDARHCTLARRVDNSFDNFAIDAQGRFSVTSVGGRHLTAWACDDGVTYFRSE